MMSDVLISLGSNYLPAIHMQWASERLALLLTDVRYSQKRWTQDIHHRGIWYMNRLAIAKTTILHFLLHSSLKHFS